MRRNALRFALPPLTALLFVLVFGGGRPGSAHETDQPTAAAAPPPTIELLASSTVTTSASVSMSTTVTSHASAAAPAMATVGAIAQPVASKSPRVVLMEVTAYCPCTKCCGPKAQGITASGKRVSHNHGLFVAADTRLLPFNTQLKIPGYANGQTVPVLDRGGAIKGHKLDLFFPTHKEALKWGRQMVEVTIVAQ